MKIVHLVSAGVIGGAEKIALQLATYQKSTGNDVALWFLFNEGPIKCEADKLGIKTQLCGLRSGWDIPGAIHLYRLLSDHHPDIIHVHTFSVGFFVGLMRRKQAIVIEHEHGCVFSCDRLGKRLNNIILRRVVHLADAFIAVSDATKCALMNTLLINNDAIRTIPNGVELSLFEQTKDPQRKKLELGIPKNSFVVGTVGRLVHDKGLESFILVAALIRKQMQDVHFVIVGDGPCRAELTTLIDELDLGGTVSLLGMRNDVPELMAVFDLFVLTSKRESFGIVLVEAMASGVPVLAFGVDGIPEIVNERCGVLLEPGDVAGLAAAIIDLLRDSSKRSTLSISCRERAEGFNINKAFSQVSQLYNDLIAVRLNTERLI